MTDNVPLQYQGSYHQLPRPFARALCSVCHGTLCLKRPKPACVSCNLEKKKSRVFLLLNSCYQADAVVSASQHTGSAVRRPTLREDPKDYF